MGFSARKKFGPFNISWSAKNGWNVSAGVGGLRVGANKKGSYLSANKSFGGLRYSRRIALGRPQKIARGRPKKADWFTVWRDTAQIPKGSYDPIGDVTAVFVLCVGVLIGLLALAAILT
jgi:hypothetical protein